MGVLRVSMHAVEMLHSLAGKVLRMPDIAAAGCPTAGTPRPKMKLRRTLLWAASPNLG